MGKIIGINLLIFLAYALLPNLVPNDTTFWIFISGYILHAIVCVIASFVNFIQKKHTNGAGFLISALLIGIIGFGTCFVMLTGGGLRI